MRPYLILFALIASGCGVRAAKVEPPTAPDTSGVIGIMGRWSICHACPIGPYEALTAAHCIDARPFDREFPLTPVRSSYGPLVPGYTWPDADIGTLTTEIPFLSFYQREESPLGPEPGESAFLVNYDWRSVDKAFAERPQEVKVLRVVAGHVIFDKSGEGGSSGSCLLNRSGRVVGINIAGKGVGFHEEVGIAVSIYGSWYYKRPEPEIVVIEEGR